MMNETQKEALKASLVERKDKVHRFLMAEADRFSTYCSVQHLREAIDSYITSGGKSLRAGILLLSCGAVGGTEENAIPAAAATEAFHAWTLMHDDIIDQDDRRRGKPTAHEAFRLRAEQEWGLNDFDARHYGESVGILAGDVLQGWATALLCDLYRDGKVDPGVVMYLIQDLNLRAQSILLDGQMMDIQLPRLPLEDIKEDTIIEMHWKKTGALYAFAGRAGAMIGLNSSDPNHPLVSALASFTGKCGIAFQLQDDVLGVIGDEELLGKPTGSDIKEGKRTIVNVYALRRAGEKQRQTLLRTFANQGASREEIDEAKQLLVNLGGVDACRDMARTYLNEALGHLDGLPDSTYKELLALWAESLVDRDY